VDAAKDQDQTGRDPQDCSHLVHQAYLDAGFEYPYANSFELYAGNENFQRVRHPRGRRFNCVARACRHSPGSD